MDIIVLKHYGLSLTMRPTLPKINAQHRQDEFAQQVLVTKPLPYLTQQQTQPPPVKQHFLLHFEPTYKQVKQPNILKNTLDVWAGITAFLSTGYY